MTSEYDRRSRLQTVSCDEAGCLRNFETQDFRREWKMRLAEGWAYVPQYENGVSVARHYCPAHSVKFDRNN